MITTDALSSGFDYQAHQDAEASLNQRRELRLDAAREARVPKSKLDTETQQIAAALEQSIKKLDF
ncbi:MAG: hypothetical protein AAB373_05575 [Patescibacteria group bacterium]